MKTRIIIDSTCDLTSEMKPRFHIVPLTVRFGSEEYIDGVNITHRQFYEQLIESDVLPQTSAASPEAFEAEFRKAQEAGESAVVLTVSSNLSGTCQSAMIASVDYENIQIVDSGTTAIGCGILAERALSMADAGMSAAEIKRALDMEKQEIRVIAMLDTLEYLKKGGRISKTAAIAGGLMNIKPVLSLVNGEIRLLGKARGSRQANNLLVQEIAKAGGVDFDRPILLGYTGLSDELLKKYIQDSAHIWHQSRSEMRYTAIGSVIGTHAGPGAIAAAFFRKHA